MTRKEPGKTTRPTGPDRRSPEAIALPVMPATERRRSPIGPSRNGRRRAIVLAAVQALLILHILLWLASREFGWFGGRTITPIEPSESMETLKHGTINAGFLFFALALLSTLLLGRWVCGWACHMILLQDLCGWMMRKVGIRPRAFRSRLLVYVPFILALYMFVWPVFYRVAVPGLLDLIRKTGADPNPALTALGLPHVVPDWPGISTHLTTTDLWATFPGILVAIPFLLVCGFATVYFLGSKGLCTYGCPYGGFFAPVDELSPARIRVSDACEQTGHCTAACTSNVRVHDEVREYGMVVDPGCMKCLDCVAACPNDALRYGFGRPAVTKGRARSKRPRKTYDLSWSEEIACALLFFLSFLAVRGVYGVVPMLMAASLAGVITFLTWKLYRLLRDSNVSLHQFRLKYRGSLRRTGWIYLGGMVLVLLLTAQSGLVRASYALAGYHERHVTMPDEIIYSGNPIQLEADQQEHAGRAIRALHRASSVREGGIGLLETWQEELDLRIARLHAARLEFDEAEHALQHAIERDGRRQSYSRSLALVLRGQLKDQEALSLYRQVLLEERDYSALLDDLVRWCDAEGRHAEAVQLCEERLQRFPRLLHTMRWLSLLYLQVGRTDEGIDLIHETFEIEPDNAPGHFVLARALLGKGDQLGAYEAIERALQLDPDHPGMNLFMGQLLQRMGRADEAQPYLDRAQGEPGQRPVPRTEP